jgi:alkaline phosphatase D
MATMQGDNPHLKWFENRRGYVRCKVTEQDWIAEYRSVPFVLKPGAPVNTASGWKLEHGRPGITRTQ